MRPLLHSLLLVEERLLEASYFARRLNQRGSGEEVRYELNAFLSAARSVTFLLQKEMSKVTGFAEWWVAQRALLSADHAAVFFLRLRNFSQKEGRVSLVGRAVRAGARRPWVYYFAGNEDAVPATLLHREIGECCREHVAKLARIVLSCTDEFPFHTSPPRAVSREGMAALGLSISEIEHALGLPNGWTEVGQPNSSDIDARLDVLARHVDGLNISAIQKLTAWRPRRRLAENTPSDLLSRQLTTRVVDQLETSMRVDVSEAIAPLALDPGSRREG